MASKPWIVRRAVVNECKPPARDIGLFTREWSLSIMGPASRPCSGRARRPAEERPEFANSIPSLS
ncbi:hypothetical protein Mnod_3068 [Methylobacterium nodulans ORS 2060]|uniref:Uncharacterized protein n=1 Tax=Methylobacterium nodulans (strain LMG 21967 / CNCM I-2342 / ORS 2060) TaxID=460265 RepID=B8IIE0_METNO|nr:hypothetical protein Mnod_3068 [Methylobacterium nodulans ORS 2060]